MRISTVTGFTVLGGGGAIGGALVAALQQQGEDVLRVTRRMLTHVLAARQNVGHVIDCIGLTGDFRSRPLDTAHAHVGVTAHCLGMMNFESFLYLSSTRVYARATATQEETPLPCMPTDPSDLYNLTKLAGETLCLNDPRPAVRVVRVSNVYGSNMADTFLGQVLLEGHATSSVRFRQTADSSKDYIGLDAVLRALPQIARVGRHRLYNLAAGHNTTHAMIARVLRDTCGWDTSFAPDVPTVRFLPIDITRLRSEFAPALSTLSDDLPTLAMPGQEVQCSPSTRPADG
jgi:nucleoside-diphosphate-sugar epimerase